MNKEEARLYLEHTSKDDFNLEEHQKVNRYEAIQVILEENEKTNNIINELEKYLIKMSDRSWDDNGAYDDVLDKIKELKGSDKE